MNCPEHDNLSVPYCPQCLANYWEARYRELKRKTSDSVTEAAYRIRFLQQYTPGEDSKWYKLLESIATDIQKWHEDALKKKE